MTHVFQSLLPIILPLAVKWAAEEEERILFAGVPLNESQLSDARILGVKHPERIRILQVSTIPLPKNTFLRVAGRAAGILSKTSTGMALGYGILVREDFVSDRNLIAHELVHTAQYERFAGIKEFLAEYLSECINYGYLEAPLEQEAMLRSLDVIG